MTPPRIAVIVATGAGGRPLLRSAESARRGSDGHGNLAIAAYGSARALPLVTSTAARLDATLVQHDTRPAAVNLAVERTPGDILVIVPAGHHLLRGALERTVATLRSSGADAIAPAIVVRTADGLDSMIWTPSALDAAAALADPRGTPSVLIVRRQVFQGLAGLDESLADLAEYEFWLRLLLAGHCVAPASEPVAARELSADGAAGEGAIELAEYRSILEKHRGAVEAAMSQVFVAREIHFGRVRRHHGELVRARDAGLAEIERLRADIAHQRAYLEHHGGLAVEWGDLRRVDPISRDWGYDRGVPIDRRHIEDFLAAHSADVRGAVLEVQEDEYTRRFGGPRVTDSSVLDIDPGNHRATVVADLRRAPELESDRFDCVILTQTLHVIDDPAAALGECHRVLKPGGVLLATVPSASRVCLEYGEDGDFWRATPAGARALAERTFVDVGVSVFGNTLTNVAFLHGLACGDMSDAELDAVDPYVPALSGIRARKGGGARSRRGLVLLYHRVDDRRDVHDLSVPPALFRAHLDWLTATCEIVALEELLGADPDTLPARAVAVTFDDGYEDNLTQASPLLQASRVPATFFLTSRWLHEPGEYWWDGLERILLGPSAVPSRLDIAGESLPTASRQDREAAHAVLHAAMVHASLDGRERTMAALLAWGGGGDVRSRPMTAAEVRELAAVPGVSFGAHTVNHLALPDQPEAVRAEELTACARDLAPLVGRPVQIAAYPYGACDRATAALARQTCLWALSCDGSAVPASFDAARVPRLDVKPWTVEELASHVERASEPPPLRRAFSRPR